MVADISYSPPKLRLIKHLDPGRVDRANGLDICRRQWRCDKDPVLWLTHDSETPAHFDFNRIDLPSGSTRSPRNSARARPADSQWSCARPAARAASRSRMASMSHRWVSTIESTSGMMASLQAM